MLYSSCSALAVVHPQLPKTMFHCPYCGLNLQTPSQQKQHVPVPIQQSASSSTATVPSITMKGKGKAPIHDADSDIEVLEVEPSITYRSRKSFSSKAFQRNRAVVEEAHREGFTTKEEKKKPKAKFDVGARRAITVSDNRAVDIHVSPAEGLAAEYQFLGTYRDATFLCQDHLLY
jgi:hypothetical protein